MGGGGVFLVAGFPELSLRVPLEDIPPVIPQWAVTGLAVGSGLTGDAFLIRHVLWT